ncbi:MAG: hypothetical protein LN412_07955, partial [Candidatus Thermoplasmatota archaeon]|nr:hypothetical protein [Candidatus Thermoplasmatota archaeon]
HVGEGHGKGCLSDESAPCGLSRRTYYCEGAECISVEETLGICHWWSGPAVRYVGGSHSFRSP